MGQMHDHDDGRTAYHRLADDDHPAPPKFLDHAEAVIDKRHQADHERAVLDRPDGPADVERTVNDFVEFARSHLGIYDVASLDVGFGIVLIARNGRIDEWHGPSIERVHDLDPPGDGQ